MPETSELSEAKRALLEKYLKGNLQSTTTTTDTNPTIDTGAQDIKTEDSYERARVVQVQGGSSKQPFFFLHGSWKGTPFFCISLAREIGVDRPFYALEAYRFDGLSVAPTIETMAAAHIKAMRAIQPEGPYLLGGWCNGGLIAYEMARQLEAQGQKLDVLVLMDAMYLGGYTRRKVVRTTISRVGSLIGLAPEKQLDWFLRLYYVKKPFDFVWHALLHAYRILQKIRPARSQNSTPTIADGESFLKQEVTTSIQRFLSTFGHKRSLLPHIDARAFTTEVLRQDYLSIVEWIAMGYTPSDLYSGKITFIWPNNEPWHIITSGWRNVLKAKREQEVETHIIVGNQETWRTIHLPILIERLKQSLSKAQRDAR